MKIGDVVSLVSGGPAMTIQNVGKAPFGRKPVSCIWFSKDKVTKRTFDAEILRKAVPAGNVDDNNR